MYTKKQQTRVFKKKRSMKAITNELWGLCREICHLRATKRTKHVYCYTSGKGPLTGQNKQLGHAFPKGALGASMKYDLRILRYQSYHDNINLGGNQVVFWKKLEEELGKPEADALYLECVASKGKPINAREYYTKLIEEYKQELAALQGE